MGDGLIRYGTRGGTDGAGRRAGRTSRISSPCAPLWSCWRRRISITIRAGTAGAICAASASAAIYCTTVPTTLAQRWITYRLRYAVGDLFLGLYQRGLPHSGEGLIPPKVQPWVRRRSGRQHGATDFFVRSGDRCYSQSARGSRLKLRRSPPWKGLRSRNSQEMPTGHLVL
jgi:hypothetical protein